MLSLNTNELMIIIKARNEAAKVLKEVEDQLWLIVEAAEAANLAISQICASATDKTSPRHKRTRRGPIGTCGHRSGRF